MSHVGNGDKEQIFDATPYLKLFIDKDGRWFQNGKEIVHETIYRQFCAMLEKTSSGGYQVRMGRELCAVEVEDAPFVVKGVIEGPHGSISLRLNDGTTELFDPARFWIGKENVPYCTIRDGLFHARFSRAAYYQIARHIEADPDGTEFFFHFDGKQTRVKQ
ncbi:MAG: DUF1285 domain-containing protein [Desulfomonilaceae bacterium]|nr:DUF1285 domain-containing protein [Desulfomonilaceae bacterium]